MPKIFISYRRQDTRAYAGRLYDDLLDHFGRDQLVRDVDTFEPGVNFIAAIRESVGTCDALVALIGPRWLTARAEKSRRLDNPNDLVRLEIAAALARDIRVIPVLLDGARMPAPDRLPDDLKGLAERQALELSDQRWREDIGRLVRALESVRGPAETEEVHTPNVGEIVATDAMSGADGASEAVVGNAVSHRPNATRGRRILDPSEPWPLIARGSIAVLFGIAIWFWTKALLLPITMSLLYLFGVYALMDGIVVIARAIISDSSKHRLVLVLEGSVSVVAAATVFIRPQMDGEGFVLLFMARAILTGVLEIVAAFRLHKGNKGRVAAGPERPGIAAVWSLLARRPKCPDYGDERPVCAAL